MDKGCFGRKLGACELDAECKLLQGQTQECVEGRYIF
jgi:hypothetical protein